MQQKLVAVYLENALINKQSQQKRNQQAHGVIPEVAEKNLNNSPADSNKTHKLVEERLAEDLADGWAIKSVSEMTDSGVCLQGWLVVFLEK